MNERLYSITHLRIDMKRNKSDENREYRNRREMRVRIAFHRSGQEAIRQRLDELDMSISDYVRMLVREDVGVYV